jgi:pseudouridine-5'-phosphate glycosidase/pseudouridine kinase
LFDSYIRSIAKQAVSHAESARHEAGKSVLYNSTSPATHKSSIKPTADILVAGSVAVDLSCDYAPLPSSSLALVAHTSNPAAISQAIGGVGHNVATAAHLIGKGTTVRLASRVADDLAGNMILSSMKERGMDITAVTKVPRGNGESINTAQYVAINGQDKALQLAMADMRIISSSKVDTDQIIKTTKPKWVVVDANWDQAVVARWIKGANEVGARVAFEPVSVPKSTVIFPAAGQTTANSDGG